MQGTYAAKAIIKTAALFSLFAATWLPCKALDRIHSIQVRKRPIDRELMVRVIIQMEQGRWDRFGGAGNMLRRTWHDRTHLSYEYSRTPEYAVLVYLQHVEWLVDSFKDTMGRQPTAGEVYMAWRYGFEGTIAMLAKNHRPECCQRAQNLYEDLAP